MILSYLIFLVFLLDNQGIYGLSCDGKDWVFAYQIPRSGGHAYKTSNDHKLNWSFSAHSIDSTKSILSTIFSNVHKSSQNFMFVMYNDRIPVGTIARKLKNLGATNPSEDTSKKFAESRGMLVWNEERNTGNAIWLIHSFPGLIWQLVLPNDARDQGRVYLCLTVKYTDIENILRKLMVMNVKVHNYRIYGSILFQRARQDLYPTTSLRRMVTYDQDFFDTKFTYYNDNKYKIITKRAKDQSIIWDIARAKLKLEEEFTVKLGKSIVNSRRKTIYPSNYNFFFQIGDKKWLIDADQSSWSYSNTSDYFCISHGVSNIVCISNPHLRYAMLIMINPFIPQKKD